MKILPVSCARLIFFLASVVICLSCTPPESSSITPYDLQCEYLQNPLGLDVTQPRFGWKLKAVNPEAYGQKQTSYRILVARNRSKLKKSIGDVWDSGWVESDAMGQIVYSGAQLVSDKTYYWTVAVRDENGVESHWSEVQLWSTGIFNQNRWTAKWIGSGELFVPDSENGYSNISDPWFRKNIVLEQPSSQAYIHVASVGYHELYVNGEKIGDGVLAPAVSDHNKRARYITYDIASALKKGDNTIALWLGTSWSIFPSYKKEGKPDCPLMIAQCDVYYANSATPALRIATDESWKTHPSPNKLIGKWNFGHMGGELWDANKEIPDWNSVSYNDSGWATATAYQLNLILSAQNMEQNKVFAEISPVGIEERPDGSYRVDMGVNFAGWMQIKLKGKPGQRIDLQFSEREQDDMTFGIQSAYIIGPSGEGVFRNRFNYSSGRWVLIKGLAEKPLLDDIKGWNVRTDYRDMTTFESSDTLQNWIYDRVRWTFENLSIGGFVVDCPQRERLGYGGDAHATSETGLFNYHLGAFYTKWMQDWRDVQGWGSMDSGWQGGGILPHTAPTHGGGGGPAWGGICISLPWYMYNHYGDTRILDANFDMMKRWLEFLDTHTENNLLKRFGGPWDFLGDWLWPNATAEGMNNDKPENICFNNCYRVYNLRTAAKIARVLGKTAEAGQWESQAGASAEAIHAKYYNEQDRSYADGSMSNLAMALLAEVVPPELRSGAMKRLEHEILVVRKGHIHAGITGGAVLFQLLRNEGRDDLIYSMTAQTAYPSWGYMKDNGATTLWEMWEKDLPGHSLLHSSYLYPGAWYIDGMAGIRRGADGTGFKSFIIRPPLLSEQNMRWAKATFDSPAGLIRSAWKKENGRLTMEVTVPPNTTATLWFPSTDKNSIVEKSGYSKITGQKEGYTLIELPAGNYTVSGAL